VSVGRIGAKKESVAWVQMDGQGLESGIFLAKPWNRVAERNVGTPLDATLITARIPRFADHP
jgi:hypothetical protein